MTISFHLICFSVCVCLCVFMFSCLNMRVCTLYADECVYMHVRTFVLLLYIHACLCACLCVRVCVCVCVRNHVRTHMLVSFMSA